MQINMENSKAEFFETILENSLGRLGPETVEGHKECAEVQAGVRDRPPLKVPTGPPWPAMGRMVWISCF